MLARRVEAGALLSLDRDQAGGVPAHGLLALTLGEGAAVALPAKIAGLWCPLGGRVQIATPDGQFQIRAGAICVSDSERPVEVSMGVGGTCVALLASQSAWAQIAVISDRTRDAPPVLFPAVHGVGGDLGQRLLRLAQDAAQEDGKRPWPAWRMLWLSQTLQDLQAEFAPLVARCPGRTAARKRQVFLRLQRVRHHVTTNPRIEFDIPQLARMANYSPWHFIKVFHAVFGEAPYAYLMRCRVEHARRLIEQGALAVGEAARAAGFESRATFSRAFRQRFSTSASELRRASTATYGTEPEASIPEVTKKAAG
ncbi:transcriptional regulator [Mizugakiibacter sediminis]|uniref:Transcriptional regulator n=2 Tax=Mizugakiibacter sediminis TaxID=1475481 RepID=A0A0K8QS40_9GAMM|nr:transcriptional regulator [Mizugakiibacter sediminis]